MERTQPLRILVIEDDSLDRALYQLCLQSEAREFEFAESDSAIHGIELAHKWRPDCILLDFNLPDLDGVETMGRLKRESDRLPCAVVMLTAFGGEELAVRAMKAGAMDYLVKGHQMGDTLARTVIHAVERFRMQERIEEQRFALDRSRQRYQTLLEAIPQIVWTASADGRMEYANRRWFDYTGLELEESACMGWDRILHPEDRERTRLAWQGAASGPVFEIEHRLKRAADASYRWHLVRAVPMRTGSGEVTHWIGTSTDIEEQKRAEIAARQEHKLQGIGVLAGGVAHDFNNLLVGIMGGASCAMEYLPRYHPAQELLEGVVRAGERAAELTSKMLSYAGKGFRHVELTNLGELVCDTCDELRDSVPQTIHFECVNGEAIPPVSTDSGQLRQVIVDLVRNAVEAIDKGESGRISVRTGVMGNYVAIEVQDTGCGMDEQTQSKIFDPFFTTKFLGRGLGLAAAYGFIRSNDGDLQVESTPGKGTTFRVLLPAAVEEIAQGARR